MSKDFVWAIFSVMLFPLGLAATEPVAQDPAATESVETSIAMKVLMHNFEAELSNLKPYLSSEEKFKDPKSHDAIDSALGSLIRRAQNNVPDEITQNPGFRFNLKLMSYQLQKVKRAFDVGAFEVARNDLNASGAFCISCHTQAPNPQGSFMGAFGAESPKAKTFENAEYLFVTRRFDMALERFDDLVRRYPDSALSESQLTIVGRRKLAYFARVERDPKLAISNFKKDLENKKLPSGYRATVTGWIASFEEWSKEGKDKAAQLDPSRADARENLIKAVSKEAKDLDRPMTVDDPKAVRFLRLSSLLYQRLSREVEPAHVQELLYWLGRVERRVSRLYWYSLHQSYWRECIARYPKTTVTKQCFEAYESDLRDQYSGVKMPDAERSNLEAMRKFL